MFRPNRSDLKVHHVNKLLNKYTKSFEIEKNSLKGHSSFTYVIELYE